MGNPQPRGLRQAPLVPSGFLCWTWLTNLRGGGRRRCPARKVEVSPETPRREGFLTIPTTHKVKEKPYGGITVTTDRRVYRPFPQRGD